MPRARASSASSSRMRRRNDAAVAAWGRASATAPTATIAVHIAARRWGRLPDTLMADCCGADWNPFWTRTAPCGEKRGGDRHQSRMGPQTKTPRRLRSRRRPASSVRALLSAMCTRWLGCAFVACAARLGMQTKSRRPRLFFVLDTRPNIAPLRMAVAPPPLRTVCRRTSPAHDAHAPQGGRSVHDNPGGGSGDPARVRMPTEISDGPARNGTKLKARRSNAEAQTGRGTSRRANAIWRQPGRR